MTATGSYKNTVNLPQTKFDMRANAVIREPELQKFWADEQIFERLSQSNPGEIFVLHDGPPYANGTLHMGHALNKTLKDIINRYQLLKGRKVRYVPGWDCHGLPIELKVIQDMKPAERLSLTPLELRQKAAAFALKTVESQKIGFKRLGVWGEWDQPYLTLQPEYEAAQIGVFGQMVLKGYIYRGLKPVHWSPSSKTALAEAELEYPEGHVSRSIFAAFKVTHITDAAKAVLEPFQDDLAVAIWTTTPWTIPANLAVAVNPELSYAIVEVSGREDNHYHGCKYAIVAADMVDGLAAKLNLNLTPKSVIRGSELEHCTYKHPLYDRVSPVIIGGDYITTESGTGLVHTAPGHGQEDYIVGLKYGLPILAPVDGDGNFTAEAGETLQGENVLGNGNQLVIEALLAVNSLLKEEAYPHKYPYDWRTKKPTIFRATEQWFASVKGFKEAALKAISEVEWIPAQGENRITPMVAERSDWCISRQRNWGVPIPVFYDAETNEPLLTEETINHVQNIFREHGSDAWYSMPVEELLPESHRHNGRTYNKGMDTMDVWFDSGSSWAAVANQRDNLVYPVDLYLEGSDQHRGWFQSSLLTSVANNGIAPFKTVLTHGFVLDEKGEKMSKSLGNIIDPMVVMDGGKNPQKDPAYGADIVRLWVSSVDYANEVRIGPNVLKQLSDASRKIRNTARFLLGNIHDFDPAKDAVPYAELAELDRYMLHRMSVVLSEITEAFDRYQFSKFFQIVQNFCIVDLSNFYLDIAKDRLYISSPTSFRRRSCQTVLAIILENLTRAIAPVLCHMAEDIWQYLPYPTAHKSVFEAGWVKLDPQWFQPDLALSWDKIRDLRTDVNKVMEQARTDKAIGSSLEAKVLLQVSDPTLKAKLQEFSEPTPSPSQEGSMRGRAVVNTTNSRTPMIDRLVNSSSLPELQQTLLSGSNAVGGTIATAIEAYSKGWRLIGNTLLVLTGAFGLYIAIGLLDIVNHIPFVQTTLTGIGIVMSGLFAVRNLLTKEKRRHTFDRAIAYKNDIIGAQYHPVRTVSLQDPTGELLPMPSVPAPVTTSPSITSQPIHHHANGIDELRYLFLASQVELIDDADRLVGLQHQTTVEGGKIGVVNADGTKCDRCWNYSSTVGTNSEHLLVCDRCVDALAGKF
ncbi:isoleucine--tRNA ligase [Chamaesiphon sp. OTE_75_metabat_556]|uniref:isoleucine--tRNA ligase n=1 Tax=Chamaesiphon sp. OTE_75_metabat_556 TaxID=2964692 RepID=UPI0037BEE9FF